MHPLDDIEQLRETGALRVCYRSIEQIPGDDDEIDFLTLGRLAYGFEAREGLLLILAGEMHI